MAKQSSVGRRMTSRSQAARPCAVWGPLCGREVSESRIRGELFKVILLVEVNL